VTLPNEQSYVEQRLIDQLLALGWHEWIAGDLDVPYLTERESFREVLLVGRLRDAVRRINVDESGQPWLDDRRVNQAVSTLERLGTHNG
jgi:type I restriction enzyme R subunit